jgi:hypothetical protein
MESVKTLVEWLDTTDYAIWFRESLYGWPTALTFHAFGTAIVIGFIFIIALRLLGLFRTIPINSLKTLFPIIWIAVVIQVWSGFSLWMTKPTRYMNDGMFQSKFSLVVISVIVTIIFQIVFWQNSAKWKDPKATPSQGIKVFVVVTTLLWAGVLVAGRLTAYLGSLYMS